MTEVIIPIKRLALAKQRLANVLAPAERAGLVLAMLEDVLATLSGLDHQRILVVGSDDAVFDIARKYRAQPVPEAQAQGYNRAVMLGLSVVADHRNAAVLPGDIPLATAAEIASLTEPSDRKPKTVRLAPARDLRGTNGLFLSDKHVLRPAFGPNSFAGYKRMSCLSGVRPNLIEMPGLALDIDTPADLRDLAMRAARGAAHDFMARISGSISHQTLNRGAA